MENTQPKTNLLKTILIIAGFIFMALLIIADGILGYYFISNIKTEQNNIKNSQEEIKNQYSSLEKNTNDLNNNLTDYKNRLIKLEVKYNNANLEEDENIEIIDSGNNSEKSTNTGCDLSKELNLRTTGNYDIFGGSEFDTVVCGYFVSQKEDVFGEEQENAYFVITKYKDEKFRENIVEGIKNGNSINKKIGDYYALNLGCKDGSKITGIQYTSEIYMDDNTQNKILSSTSENPISLIISFDKHEGAGCTCCNLASKIRLY